MNNAAEIMATDSAQATPKWLFGVLSINMILIFFYDFHRFNSVMVDRVE